MSQDRNSDSPSLRLHDFLRDENDAILHDWERLDRKTLASARALSSEALRNNIPRVLDVIANQSEKAAASHQRLHFPKDGPKTHAKQRWQLAFSLGEMTREYALLRTVILQKLVLRIGELAAGELVFLNRALDEAIMEGVATYVASWNHKLESERERLLVTLRGIGDGVVSTDPDGRVTYLNPAAREITGWSGDDVLGRSIEEVILAVDNISREPTKSLTRVAAERGEVSQHSHEILLRRRDGELLAVEETAAPLHDSRGGFLGVVTTFRDVSKIRATTAQLGYLAAHDSLTGLPNRALLIDRVAQELAHAERGHNRLALLYLDLDLFKNVNDTLGHAAGDKLLKQVAHRLQESVRRTDTVSRLGGDEFVILLVEFGSLTYLSELGNKIAAQLRAPFSIDGETVDISTSIGISIFPEDGRDQETLIKHADIAMYHAKTLGRNNVQFFAPEMNRRANERGELQGDLRRAVAGHQLFLNFQPQIALDNGRVIGAEVLLRWRHPHNGLIPPGRFIPVAEDNRQIMVAIGNWVLEQTCQQSRAWLNAGYPPLRLSVNVSIVQLQYKSLLEKVDEVLRRFWLSADQLQLELTESVLMSDIEGALDQVRALEARGVRIAVDDFGTGYSSLSYLKDLPVDELKIDQSFVCNIASDPDKASIVQAIIRMGQSLKLRVIAEGVENQETASFLAANGCEGAQGYYYGRPLTAAAFERQFLRAL